MKIQHAVAALKMEGGPAKEYMQGLEAGKGRETDSPPEPSGRTEALSTPWC